jgi:hypothetical protein
MNISDRADKIESAFIDEFTIEFTSDTVYKMCSEFQCARVPSLQDFLVKDYNGMIKPYIVWDNEYKIIVGYFTLITSCMFCPSKNQNAEEHFREKDVNRIIPCVELQHFAVNDAYLNLLKDSGYSNANVGQYIFDKYITDVVVILSSQINFRYVILHAVNHPKVINSYREKGFETFEDDEDNIVPLLENVKSLHSDYSGECKFMFKDIDSILSDSEWR